MFSSFECLDGFGLRCLAFGLTLTIVLRLFDLQCVMVFN